jgi:predicted transcriptional regulator/transcriptional regulator with XRE-family HTH domain
MAERKIFAGGRVKRLRQRLSLSQTQMASAIGVSPSYLNLIERNQRPLTVQVLLKLSGAYGIDVAELSSEEGASAVEALREVFADPLLTGEIASPAELADFAEAAPNAARGTAKLFQAYREALERLSDLSQRMASDGGAPAVTARLPLGEASAYFEAAGPWFPALEEAAASAAERLAPRDDPAAALKAHLKEQFGVDVRVLPHAAMPADQARYDRHSLRLFLSERVPLVERPFLMARQAALLGHRPLLDLLTEATGLAEPEAVRLCRSGFVRRLAEAMLAPAERLANAARDSNFDLTRLSERFLLRPSRVMARLAALGAGGLLPPAFVLVADASGGVLARQPGAGFPFPRLAPVCARLPLFDEVPAWRAHSADIALPDGSAFRVTAVAEEGQALPGLPPPRRLALIGWRRPDEPPGIATTAARPVGVTCRLCERLDCAHRLQPPVTRPAGFTDHVVPPSDHELIG